MVIPTNIQDVTKKYWVYFAVLLLGFALGFYACHQFFPRTITAALDPVVQTEVQYQETTAVQYVPKVSSTDSDVEINKGQPGVSVSFNGEQHDFALVQGETQKFDKGKLVVDQSSTLKLDVSAEVKKQVSDGITEAFSQQQKAPKYRIGIEGGVENSDSIDATGDLRISRQSNAFDVDARINKDKQSITATWWFK